MDTSIFTPTIDINIVATDVTNNTKIDEKQINDAMNQQIENFKNAKIQDKIYPYKNLMHLCNGKQCYFFNIYFK